jgi:glyoxylase-like metal-dependent hydrolase (beta-lactamase superfamily II)
MKRAMVVLALGMALSCGLHLFGAPARFQRASDHSFYLQLKESGDTVAAVVTDEGILLINPPSEPDLAAVTDALKRISLKPVRWVVFSDPHYARSAGARYFSGQGAILIAGARLLDLAGSVGGGDTKGTAPGGNAGELPSTSWLVFEHQVNLFPSNVEIRITALQQKAMTGGDVVVYLPAEKVLFVGHLYEAARYPDIDTAAQGNADAWIDGLKQVVDSVPVLKPAIQQAKPDPKTDLGKTLEEGIAVISAHGDISNLQNMKDLLSACQKLRSDIAKSLRSGRGCEDFLASPRADAYRSYGNLHAYASQLCDALPN